MKYNPEKRKDLLCSRQGKTIFVRRMAKITTFLVWLCIVMLFSETCYAFWSRRRRRRRPPPPPPCVPRNCVVSHWSNYGSCSYPCGTGGVQWKTRYVKKAQSCGGQCPYHLRESKACNVGLCANHGRPHSTGCSCRAGYTGKCCHNDVNECNSNPCQHVCHNTYGSFTCQCHPCYTKLGRQCELRQCQINGHQCFSYGTINPSNSCQKCHTSKQKSWTNDDSLPCNDGVACTRNDHCSNGRCIGTPFSCLSCEECYNDACRIKPGHCIIIVAGVRTCFAHGELRPGYPCQQCDSNNINKWTINNNLPCSDNNMRTKDDHCVTGICVGTFYNCPSCEAHDGSGCPIKPGYCVIQHRGQKTCFARNQYKPGNPCQWCNPGGNNNAWSNRDGMACDDGNRCTRGDKCIGGQCSGIPFTCNSLCQFCNGTSCTLKTGFGLVNKTCMCKIADRDYSHQAVNPSNQCQWCDLYDTAARANSAWSNRPAVPCDDGNKCTMQDTCNAGRCAGLGYSCHSSQPTPSCIKASECVGDGTCRPSLKSNRTICRPALDACDQPERCDGILGSCPGIVRDDIFIKIGEVQIVDSKQQSPIQYQYITDRLFLKISGFSSTCGSISLRWSLLLGTSPCSFNVNISGTLKSNDEYQTVRGLSLQDMTSYKIFIRASDLRGKIYQPVCSKAVVIDTSKPQGGWVHDGPRADLSYQASELLQVNWGGVQARHGVSKYEWKVLVTSMVTNKTIELMPFTTANLNTNAQRGFDNMEDGSKVTFIVRVFTKAGLFSELTSDGVIIDTSAPIAGKVNDGNQIGRDLKYANWTSTFTANWEQFTDPHSPIARYTLAVQREGTGLITTFKATAQDRSSTVDNVNLVSKESYCAVVRGYNKAGLYSQVKSDCLLIDHDAPHAGTVNDGHFSDIDYQSENTMIAANWHGFTDGYKGSGISEYKYKVMDSSGSTIIPWTSAGNSTNITHNGLTLSNSIKYFVIVKAIDAVGLSVDVTSDGFNVDTTHPVFTGKITVTGKDDVLNGTPCVYIPSISSVRVKWLGFSDAHSGLKSYLWAIVPSDSTPMDSDFKIVPGPNLPTSASFSGLALTQGKGYVFIIRAYNGANRFKDARSVLIVPDSTPPSPGYLFDGPNPQIDVDYQADLRHVYASWTKFPEPHTEVKQYYLAVGSCMTGNHHVTGNTFIEVTPSTTTSFMLANVSLTNGQKYCVKLKAENKAGLVSLEVSSDGFIADATPPSARKAQVRDGNTGSDLDFQESNTTLSSQWDEFADPESGIERYEYGVSRNRAVVPNILPFQNVGMNTSAAMTGLTLTDGVYYVLVCALNKAGLRICISSDGVLIDLSLPSHGVVHDGIMAPDRNYQSSLTSIAANWEGIWDLDSGIEKFEWSIGTSNHDKTSVLNYTDVGLSTHVRSHGNLNLISGKKYYVHLKVTNQAGLVRELSSDGIVADGTPPIPSAIYPGSGSNSKWNYNDQEQVFYSDDTSAFHVYWDEFSEPESEIWYYKWAIGTSKCGTQVQPLINIGQSNYVNSTKTDLVFRYGVKYFVTVTARNRAGLVSQSCSDAFIFDRTPPLSGKVNFEEASSKTANKTFLSNINVAMSWEGFTDQESGIRACNVSVLDGAGKALFTTSSNASSGNLTIPGNITLHRGEYTAHVKCINNARLFSMSSALFVIDNTPPFSKGPIVAGVSPYGFFQYQSDNTSITASWPPFADDESNVESYFCAIGSEPYKDDIIPFENVGLATELTETNLRLSHRETYFITVISRNQAGLSSNITSLGLKIDTSPPLAESKDVKDGKYDEDIDFFSSGMEFSGRWEDITDPESGISESKYCVGTSPYGCQIKAMTSTGKNKSFVCPECVAKEGERVFVTVCVTNGAGLSKTVSSDGMLFDSTPPSIDGVIDGSQIEGMDSFAVLENWNVSVSCLGVEDPESGVQSCIWTIKDINDVVRFEKNITSNSISLEKIVFTDSKTYRDLGIDKSITCFNVLTCWNKAKMQATARSDGFHVKTVWPFPGRVRDGVVMGTDLDYLNNTKVIGANWDPFVSDIKDPVVSYEIAIGTSPGREDILSYLNIGLKRITEKDLAPEIPVIDVLKSGVKYYVTVRGTTLSGLSSVEHSDGFTVDPSPPLKAEVSVSHTVVDQETQMVEISVSWSGVKDHESGIRSSAYCLQTNPQTCGSGPVLAGLSLQGAIGPFRPDSWGEYYVTVVIENRAGLRTVMSSKKLTFDATPPSKGTVIDGISMDIDFVNSMNALSVAWRGIDDEESGVVSCSWAIVEQTPSDDRSLFGNETLVFTTAVESEGNLTQANLSLVPGARYISEITCTNGDGFRSTSSSDGVIVDFTPPKAGLVYDGSSLLADVGYQSSTSSVEAVWTPFEDQESGVVEYCWAIGTVPEATDAMNFTTVGKKLSAKAMHLSLSHGVRYYVTVQAKNGAGMTSHISSDGFEVDATPPELTEVTTGLSPWIGPSRNLHASWKSQDQESEISRTEFCVGTLPVGCQIKYMTEIAANSTQVSCTDCHVTNNGTYYISIRVTNGAGLFTVVTTTGVTVDLTAPYLGEIVPQFYVTSCTSNCTLLSNITSVEDGESGIRLCSFAIRNSTDFLTDFIGNGLSMIVKATGLLLVPGQSYFTLVRCENNVGLIAESLSSAVIVDDTPPSKGSVIVSDDRTHDVFGLHSSCHLFNKTMRVHWFGFNDLESEVSGFRVAVGKHPNATDVLQFQDVGLVTNITLPMSNSSTLFDGDIVYVTVESRNPAGLITQSTSPPTRLVSVDNEEYLEQGDFYCLDF